MFMLIVPYHNLIEILPLGLSVCVIEFVQFEFHL